MDWKDLQPIATLLAAIAAAVISSFTLWKLQNKKRNDDTDLMALNHSLAKHLKEFEQKLIEENSYLSEKGKNIATKKDVDEITRKVETIRNEFTTTTEILKWQLSKKATLHRLQAEKEFEVYTKLWDIITELRLAFENIRPVFDPQPVGTNWTELWQKRKQAVIESRDRLLIEVEKQRPFYPEALYFELRNLVDQALAEILDFEASLEISKTITPNAKKRGKENLDKFVETLEKACDSIRNRISES